MATNEILQFATTNTGTNLLTQAEYAADSQRTIGHQPGIARSKLENKVLRQASLMAAGLAEFIADYQSNNVTDALTAQNIADYLLAALQGSLAVTPPQFDNDSSLATSEFVQRALGNFQTNQIYASNVTLTASQVGTSMSFNSGNCVLPLHSAVPLGSSFLIYNAAGTAMTISTQGGDTLYLAGPRPTSMTLTQNNWVMVVKNSVDWIVLGSSVLSPYTPEWSKSFTNYGYQKFPSGLIFQWTVASGIAAASHITGNWPITFPNAFLGGSANVIGTADNDSVFVTCLSNQSDRSTYTLYNHSGGSTTPGSSWLLGVGY